MKKDLPEYIPKTIAHPQEPVRSLVWASSAARCASCGKYCLESSDEDGGFKGSIGNIAHIRAKSDSGARADATLTKTEREEFRNLILLCSSCHGIVDAFPKKYPVELLIQWKEEQIFKARESWNADRRNTIGRIQRYLRLDHESPELVGVLNREVLSMDMDIVLSMRKISLESTENVTSDSREANILRSLDKSVISNIHYLQWYAFDIGSLGNEHSIMSLERVLDGIPNIESISRLDRTSSYLNYPPLLVYSSACIGAIANKNWENLKFLLNLKKVGASIIDNGDCYLEKYNIFDIIRPSLHKILHINRLNIATTTCSPLEFLFADQEHLVPEKLEERDLRSSFNIYVFLVNFRHFLNHGEEEIIACNYAGDLSAKWIKSELEERIRRSNKEYRGIYQQVFEMNKWTFLRKMSQFCKLAMKAAKNDTHAIS